MGTASIASSRSVPQAAQANSFELLLKTLCLARQGWVTPSEFAKVGMCLAMQLWSGLCIRGTRAIPCNVGCNLGPFGEENGPEPQTHAEQSSCHQAQVNHMVNIPGFACCKQHGYSCLKAGPTGPCSAAYHQPPIQAWQYKYTTSLSSSLQQVKHARC